jgi:hypothetical protein
MTPAASAGRFRVLGQVVEIVQGSDGRQMVVVLDSGTIIEVPLDDGDDLHLGDRITVEGLLAIGRLTSPGDSTAASATDREVGAVSRWWRHEP